MELGTPRHSHSHIIRFAAVNGGFELICSLGECELRNKKQTMYAYLKIIIYVTMEIEQTSYSSKNKSISRYR